MSVVNGEISTRWCTLSRSSTRDLGVTVAIEAVGGLMPVLIVIRRSLVVVNIWLSI